MAVSLTSEERTRIAAAAIRPLPTYYNAALGTDVGISTDFEAFLILRGKEANRSTVDWLSKTVELHEETARRDSLVKEFLDADKADNDAVLEEIETKLSEFNDFRDNYESGRFAGAVEVSTLLQDMQRPADEMFFAQEQAKHLQNMHVFVQEALDSQGLTSEITRQIQSWLTPLLAY